MSLLDKIKDAFKTNAGPEQLTTVNEQPREDQELAEWTKQQLVERRQASSRITHEGIWMTNIAYTLGFDAIYYDTTTRQFKTVGKAPSYLRRNRIHVNKILPNLQNRLARLCKNPPKYDTRPKSNSDEDREASRLALQIGNNVLDINQAQSKRMELYMWKQQTGHSYIHVLWDETMGDEMVDPENPDIDFQGEIRVDVCSPFECFPEGTARTLKECNSFIRAKVRKLEYFREKYPERGHLVKEEDAWLLSAQYESRINALNNQGVGQTNASGMMKNSAIEISYYERKSRKHPSGRHIISANGVLLKDKPLCKGKIPFVKFDDIVVAGKYYPECVVTHARPVQDQYNRLLAKRAEWTNKLLAGKYIAPKGSGLTQESMNDQSGEVVYAQAVPNSFQIQSLQVPNIPSYAYTEEDRLKEIFDEIFGIGQVSKGQLPSASIPAIGMQLLTEQDDTRIGVITERDELGWAEVMHLILCYAEEYYKMPRLLKVAGKNAEYEVKSFLGADICGNNDVICIRGSTLPGSKVLKRQELLNIYNQGLLGDPKDTMVQQKVLDRLELGDVGDIWREQGLIKSQIKRALDQILNHEIPNASEFDNHELFLKELNDFRISEKFLTMDPEQQMILLGYMEDHMKKLTNRVAPGVEDQFEDAKGSYDKMLDEQSAGEPQEIPA